MPPQILSSPAQDISCKPVEGQRRTGYASSRWRAKSKGVSASHLFAVLVFQPARHFVVELAVVGVDGCAECRLGGTALGKAFQDARDLAHAITFADVFGRCQGLGIGYGR